MHRAARIFCVKNCNFLCQELYPCLPTPPRFDLFTDAVLPGHLGSLFFLPYCFAFDVVHSPYFTIETEFTQALVFFCLFPSPNAENPVSLANQCFLQQLFAPGEYLEKIEPEN